MENTDGSEKSNFRTTHRINTKKRLMFIVACIIGCLMVTIYAATVGSFPISNGEVFNALLDAILRRTPEDMTIYHIVVHLRMPAIITALVCGFALAVCGVCMQSMLKNKRRP